MTMYQYRHLSVSERADLLNQRRMLNLPLHEPPHYPAGAQVYLISAACFRHQPYLNTDKRRIAFQGLVLDSIAALPDAEIKAWAILPNHYHVLARVDLDLLQPCLARLHNRTATIWNREDHAPGRKVWFRFSDRRIRGERHYYASLNYIHANPVKHGYVRRAGDWPCCSAGVWVEQYGRDWLRQLWAQYPVGNYGAGWDD